MGLTDRYKKEDAERAQAVLDALHRDIGPLVADYSYGLEDYDAAQLLARFQKHIPFLMEVFRAVRGERD